MDTSSALSEGSRISEAPTSGFIRYQNVNAEYLVVYGRTRLVAQAPEEKVALERAAAIS